MLNKNHKKGSFWKSLLLVPAAIILFFVISCNNQGAKDVIQDTDASASANVIQDADVPVSEKPLFYVVEEMSITFELQ